MISKLKGEAEVEPAWDIVTRGNEDQFVQYSKGREEGASMVSALPDIQSQ
jgi:hypothetical protein